MQSDIIEYAEKLYVFVKTAKELHGDEILSHNFHNLLHLADDCKNHDCLENFSNFSSENYLQSILKKVRKHDKPLQQIVRRNEELMNNLKHTLINEKEFNSLGYRMEGEIWEGILVEGCRGPCFKNVFLSISNFH